MLLMVRTSFFFFFRALHGMGFFNVETTHMLGSFVLEMEKYVEKKTSRHIDNSNEPTNWVVKKTASIF